MDGLISGGALTWVFTVYKKFDVSTGPCLLRQVVDSVLINYNLGNTLNELYKGVFNSE